MSAGLFEVLTMDDNIICIPFKLYLGMVLFYRLRLLFLLENHPKFYLVVIQFKTVKSAPSLLSSFKEHHRYYGQIRHQSIVSLLSALPFGVMAFSHYKLVSPVP